MYLPCGKRLLIIVLIFWGGALSAQTNNGVSNPLNGRENNPYSKYGIGELTNGNSAALRGMSNISSTYADPFEINTDNPASYAYLQRTTFQLGAMASTRTLQGSGLTYKTGTGTLSYLSLGLPVGKKGGLCLGFRPVSRVYYKMDDTVGLNSNPVSPIGPAVKRYEGDGGLNYAFIGAARRFKNLSIGVNAGYLFGTISKGTVVAPYVPNPNDSPFVPKAYTAYFVDYARIGGIYWKAGATYQIKLDSNYILRIGGTFSMNQNVRERFESYGVSVFNFGDTLVNDTMYNAGKQNGKLTMPMSYSLGVMIANSNKWNIGIDFSAMQWSGFKSNPDTSKMYGVGSSSYKISIGGSYTPNAGSVRGYLQRVTYRLGFYYGKDYLNIVGTTLPLYGITVGGSLPFKRSFGSPHSAVDLALDMGRLGTQQNNLIQQSYMRFTVGISLNDKWFTPRKYD